MQNGEYIIQRALKINKILIHKRTYRIEFVDNIKYYKTIIVDIALDRTKEWELTFKDFGFKVNNNKINSAKKEIKELLRNLHQDYLNNKLDEELKDIYAEYIKPYFGKTQTPQSENVKKLREQHRNSKLNLDN